MQIEALEEFILKRAKVADFVIHRYPNADAGFWKVKIVETTQRLDEVREYVAGLRVILAKTAPPQYALDPAEPASIQKFTISNLPGICQGLP